MQKIEKRMEGIEKRMVRSGGQRCKYMLIATGYVEVY